MRPYFNGPRGGVNIPEFKTLQTAGAFDEGGNFIQVTYGPLTLVDFATGLSDLESLYDYHITAGSLAIGAGGSVGGLLELDFDNEARPWDGASDIGADELH